MSRADSLWHGFCAILATAAACTVAIPALTALLSGVTPG